MDTIIVLLGLVASFIPNALSFSSLVQQPGICLRGSTEKGSSACRALSLAFPNAVFLPNGSNNANYTIEAKAIWSQEAWKTPACIFAPANAYVLADGLRILVRRGVDFAIRSGGHMPVAGHNSFGLGGIMLATTRFTEMQTMGTPNEFGVDYVRAGAAFRWQELYEYLEARGLLCVGGTVSSVGSSLLLGGGLTYFSGTRGWAANNVVNYEVVLANSSIIQVNNKTAPDLFWALKGGANNFGIVTRYDLLTFPTRTVYGGSVSWASNDTQRYLDAQTAFIAPGGGSRDPKAAIMPSFAYFPTTKQNLSTVIFLYDGQTQPKAFENFTSIPPASGSLGTTTLVGVVNTTEFYAPRTNRWTWANIAILPSKKTMNMVYRNVVQAADQLLPGVNCTVGASVQSITKAHLQTALDLGGDAIDLDPLKGDFVIALIYAEYPSASSDAVVQQFLHTSIASLSADAKATNLFYPWIFLNQADANQDPIATYGYGVSKAKMLAIARKYDPRGIFQKNVPGFKLTGEIHAC